MDLDELIDKCVHIEFHDGNILEGFLIDINLIDDDENMISYKTLIVKDYEDKCELVYLNEIETIEEIK